MNSDLLKQLYARYYNEIYLYLFSLSHSKEISEDLTQETFLKGMLTLEDRHSNPRAWLFMVARNLYIDYHRKYISRQKSSDADETLENIPVYDDVADRMIRDEGRKILYKALQRLDIEKREIIQLQYFMNVSQKEISSILRLTPENVRVKSYRAKKELRKILEDDGYDL